MKRIVACATLVLVSSLFAADAATKNLGSITVKVPAGWKSVTPSSAMRKAQFTLPKVHGDKDDAELVVFNFGSGQGGSVEDNLKRWYAQLKQPDGSQTEKKARVTKKKVDGMHVTEVDVTGTYVAAKQMMNPAAGRYNEPDYRMLAAIVEAPDSSYYFKLVGPGKTVARWASSFNNFVSSIRKAK